MKMKKLIPALAMLLVSAILLGTSTYAWFSMNTEVSATGMQITAKSDSTFLVIVEGSTFDNTASTTTVTSTASEKQLYPAMPATTLTSANVATASSWQFAYSDDPADYTKATGYTACSTLENYVGSETFSIGLNNTSGVDTSSENIKLRTVTLPADTGISCVVVCGDVIQKYEASSSTALDLGVKANKTGTTVTVYYYINGEDTNVYSDNAAALTGQVSLNFDVNA